jgi:DNA adenine methylase
MQFSTPLRYPGGKGKLTEFIKRIVVDNELLDGCYAEPYAGGAAIALSLLFQDYIAEAHINDLNLSVHAFWSSVLNRSDALCRMIEDVDVSMNEWHIQKQIQSDPTQVSLLELGFSTFFLNRTNRSGIIKGGVIGGKNQDGKWKLDARFNKPDLILRIQKIARYRSRITLHNLDARDFIAKVVPTLPVRTLVYLDPPYYVKGEGLYQDFYRHDDHVEIATLVREKISCPWVVSYDAAPEIKSLYKGYPHIAYGLNYSAQDRYQGAEFMFFSKALRIPDVENPAGLKAA